MVVVIIEVVVIKSSSIVSYIEIKTDPNNSRCFLRGVVNGLFRVTFGYCLRTCGLAHVSRCGGRDG